MLTKLAYWQDTGSFPWHKSIKNATAYTLQFIEFDCICTFSKCTWFFGDLVRKMAAICFNVRMYDKLDEGKDCHIRM